VAKVRAALEGTRNEQLNKSAFALGTLIGGGELDQALVADTLLEAARACGLGEGEARKTIASGLEAGKKKPRTVAPPVAPAQRPPASAEPASIHAWTPAAYIADRPGMLDSKFLLSCLSEEEYGDAKLLARLYDGKLCYDHAEKAWYVWGGHAWYRDQTLLIRHLIAGQVARQYLLLAADSDGMTPKSQIELLTKRAIKLRTLNRCNNIASFAQSFLGITGEEWDRNPWLLGVANGVLDLRSGKLRPGQPGDYIRTVIPTIWRGIDEPAPRFEQFIGEIFDNNQQIGAFVQRLLGYGITGLTVEHIFPVLYGEKGRNGKDTLLETLKAVLGDCADTVSTDVLLAQSGRGNAQPHLVDLMGKRLVWASETSVNARLNEAQVKLITGGGTVKTRPLYGNMIEFDPTHLVLLITNHKPRANADDDALWNRIVLLPFTLRFVANPAAADERQRDPHLRQKLTRERSGILAWLIRGCLAWQQQGLAIPDEVRASTDEYRNEEDLINQFIEENCLVGPQAECAAKDLYQSYRDWAEDMGMNPMGNNSFGRRIGKRFERKRTNRAFSYIGIGLLSSQNSDRSDRSDPLIRKVPMENEIHEKSFVLKDHFDHFDTQNNGFTASESETSLEQIDHASEKSITSAHPPPGQGAAGRAIPLQGAGKPNVNDERRDLITQARALLKDVGTASELATVDVSGRSVQELRTLIGRLEERRNQYE
jgi:putative DNA primase/helicase